MTKEQVKQDIVLHWYHWLAILASLIFTLIVWKVSVNQIHEGKLALFKAQSEQLLAQITERMSHYEVALKAGAAVIQNFPKETQAVDWKTFSEKFDITNSYPDIIGIGVIFNISPSNINRFIEQQRQYRQNFSIHPQHNKKEHWPITYIEPIKNNEQAVGLDIAFEINRLNAAKEARDTAKTTITAPIALVQNTKNTLGFLQFIPFYNSNDIGTVALRKQHFVGHVYAPFIINKFMESTLKQSNRQLVFSIYDGDDNLYNELTPNNSNYDKQPLFQQNATMNMYGRVWTLNIQSSLSFKTLTHSNQPMLILASGIMLNAILFFFFLTLTRSQKKAILVAEKITQTLSIKKKYYKHIIESAPCGMIIVNSQGEIEEINPQISLLFGYKSQELVGNKIDILIPKRFQKQHPKHRESFNNSPSNRQMGLGREVFGLTKNGNEFPAEIGLAQFKDGDNLKTLATIIDMTEHVQITEELKRSNKELNDFAYVASHDLKAPLRGIMQISSWIEEDIADFANDETKSNLTLLMSRTSRLESLLEDLLSYSRIGRNQDDIKTIDVKKLILNIFDLQNPPKNVSIVCQETLPEITTYLVPLETIFRNLISNAIKHKNDGDLVITISADEYPTYYRFSVEDNGPGIPEKHHQKIFELFKTLKPRDEVEGSGMGLAIIKKLLDYQKCVINVKSDGSNGTCFSFTWPK
jgi:PAS domain S-box-containing protein